MTIKEKHKDLKKKVNIAEEKRNIRRGQKSWYDLRTLKKLKLKMKDKLVIKKYSHELINFKVTENLLNKWKNSSNKTYQALEEEIDFTDEFTMKEASGVVKGKCKVL